jgi:hypothetical protein
MYIVWGSRLMGKCDVVPGLFHVATKFGHIYYIPLIPTASFVVLSKDGDSFRGVPIGLSFKSILIAWLRAGLFVAAMISSCSILVFAGDRHHPSLVGPIATAVVMWLIFALTWHKFITRAGFARACAIAEQVGIQGEGMEAIRKIYGMPPARGFEVQKPGSTVAARAPMAAAPVARTAQRSAAAPQSSRRPAVADDAPIPLEPMSGAPAPKAKPQAPAQPQRKGPRPPGQIGIA